VAAFSTGVNANELLARYSETARYDLNPKNVMRNFVSFAEELVERKLVSASFLEQIRTV
jgi:hypothetical protein